MSKSPLIATVEALITPVVEGLGLELYDLDYLTEYGRKVLRLYIEKESGATLDDCEKVSYAVEPVLDANDPIPGAYVLEVSSPGIERKLVKDSHYARYSGQQVEVKLYRPLSDERKQKVFRGILRGLEDDTVIISDTPEENLHFNRKDMIYCRLVYPT